ncbi:LAME_0D00210g1_1 [Lachancea meyersii CBS 8951]|uniref:LAME_0D00210g1_1 n=1 Tax=Lachancea meyersii CBS 8951 TaxID=1266667 RepID=A0A1G4J5L4_9SACH|nr:LAME_0D00210g1_1 [Lachancea meyersii CBS 8951]
MGYKEAFANTFLTDVLEYAGLIQIDSNFVQQTHASASSAVSKKRKCSLECDPEAGSEVDVADNANSEVGFEVGSEVGSAEEVDPFLVDWNGDSDPENPLNWSSRKRAFVVAQTMLLTCTTYMGASIYTPGQQQIQEQFHVGHVVGTLNLSLYVFGYGLGPIVFSPLSEVTKIGRQPLYIVTLFLFMIFQAGAATVNNMGGLAVIRFISGVLCSPSLATGGATMGDIISPEKVPVILGLWAVGAVAAPVIAPLLGAAMVVAKDWRWVFWLLMIISAFTLVLLVAFFPETQHNNILHRRAKRLRKQTGDNRYYTRQERADLKIDIRAFLKELFVRPFLVMIMEPAVLAFDLYISLCYGAFYLFFEAFPIVFIGIYKFTLVEMGLAYMGFCVGCVVAYTLLILFLSIYITPKFKNGTFQPEHFLVLAMIVCWSLPFSLFLFGWTARVHWILPIISEIFFVLNVFNLFQSSFAYLAICYPRYLASVFASNGLCRAVFACVFPLFGQAMYKNLGSEKYPVGWGSSLVGFFCIGLAAIPFVFYKYGPTMRGKSRYAN